MKKSIICLVAIAALSLQSCITTLVDYGCDVYYKVENLTGQHIYITHGKNKVIPIAPDKTEKVWDEFGLCGEKTKITDNREEGRWPEAIGNMNVYTEGGKQVNGDLLKKENWAFMPEEYYSATYLLSITDAMIESAGYVEEE